MCWYYYCGEDSESSEIPVVFMFHSESRNDTIQQGTGGDAKLHGTINERILEEPLHNVPFRPSNLPILSFLKLAGRFRFACF